MQYMFAAYLFYVLFLYFILLNFIPLICPSPFPLPAGNHYMFSGSKSIYVWLYTFVYMIFLDSTYKWYVEFVILWLTYFTKHNIL